MALRFGPPRTTRVPEKIHMTLGGCPPVNPNDEKAPYTARGVINVIDTDKNTVIDWVPVVGYDARDPTKAIGAYDPVFAPDGKHVAVITGSGIRYYNAGVPSASGNRDLERIYPTITRASALAFSRNGSRMYVALPEQKLLEEIAIVPPTATPGAVVTAVVLAILLGAIVAWIVFDAFRQGVPRFVGAQWRFASGKPAKIFDVIGSSDVARILPRRPSPVATEIIFNQPGSAVSSPDGLVALAKQLEGLTSSIVVDRALFGITWQPIFGSDWAQGARTSVAGQVVRGDDLVLLPHPALARLTFSALAFRGHASNILFGADLEIRSAV